MRANARLATVEFSVAALAVLSIGAAAIHFAVIADHFKEWWLIGLFFAGLGWFQALWSVAYLLFPARRLGWLAIGINLATVLLWAWTRTLGLPLGPDPGVPEPVGIPDSLASVLELLLVIGLFKTGGPALSANVDGESQQAILATLAVAVVVAGATSAAIVLGGM